jgi:hypothetical protein
MENISVGMNSKAIYEQEHKELGNCEAAVSSSVLGRELTCFPLMTWLSSITVSTTAGSAYVIKPKPLG